MDRNKVLLVPELVPWVALRKESVDRNVFGFGAKLVHSLSLSARRAWIEISASGPHATGAGSLSARRAWIEMSVMPRVYVLSQSLSARRAWIEMCICVL